MIWCIEDDEGIREIELYTLRQTGFEARGFPDAAEFFTALKTEKPELVILDVMLPGMDGTQVLQKMKEEAGTADIPVIMATARGQEYDKIQSLDMGADDYLVKPFGMMEMVSRIKAVLRRCQQNAQPHLLKLQGLAVNLDEHTVTCDQNRITLTLKEYDLLVCFLSHPGFVFTRDQLFARIWGSDFTGESRTVDMHIRTLRMKLGSYGKWIETVRGVGYRLEEKSHD